MGCRNSWKNQGILGSIYIGPGIFLFFSQISPDLLSAFQEMYDEEKV